MHKPEELRCLEQRSRFLESLGKTKYGDALHRSHNNKFMISQLDMARASEPSLGRHEMHTILPFSAADSGATAADKQFSADSTARDKKSACTQKKAVLCLTPS